MLFIACSLFNTKGLNYIYGHSGDCINMQSKMKPKYQVHFIKEIVRSLGHAARSLIP